MWHPSYFQEHQDQSSVLVSLHATWSSWPEHVALGVVDTLHAGSVFQFHLHVIQSLGRDDELHDSLWTHLSKPSRACTAPSVQVMVWIASHWILDNIIWQWWLQSHHFGYFSLAVHWSRLKLSGKRMTAHFAYPMYTLQDSENRYYIWHRARASVLS